MNGPQVSAVVLGAGSSTRLGQPKQLLEFRGKPLLQTAVDQANAGPFTQVLVTVGGAGTEVLNQINFGAATAVENLSFATGCSSSIVAALDEVDESAAGFVLLLGDQPGVTDETVDQLIAACAASALGVCSYDDGIGHPFWLGREVFDDVRALAGDKAVWKLIESGKYPVTEVERPGPVPQDVDTWEDYERLLELDAELEGSGR